MQQTLHCCGTGVNGSFEWQSTDWFLDAASAADDDADNTPKVPDSCCVPAEQPGYLDAKNNDTFLNRDKCLGEIVWKF